MADEGFKRKLTSILSADAVGYSRLMEDDEEATVRTLTSYRKVLTTLIQKHNGMVVDFPGDNVLAKFGSVVDAVQCAVSVQNEIDARNEDLPENRKMEFRIGINLGDVIQEGERIYGDGVNIAARLEGLATPGGICISKTAFDQIERKLPYGYEFIGDQKVKNISKPVGAYRVMLQPRVTVAGEAEKEKEAPGRRKALFIGVAALLVMAVAVGIWQFYLQSPTVEPASEKKMAFPLPQKPSVAILPFVNMTGDPDKDYLADGISENITTVLSTIPDISVIDRNSSLSFKEKSAKVKQVAEELGVQYAVEGSLQRAGEGIQITARLLDALKGQNLWAKRFKKDLNDISEVQDEININILKAIYVESIHGSDANFYFGTNNLEALNYFKKGREYFLAHKLENYGKAIEQYRKALEIDPDYSAAWASLAWVYHELSKWGVSGIEPRKARKLRTDCLTKALEINSTNPEAQALLAEIYQRNKEYETAIKQLENAIQKTPNSAFLYYKLGELLSEGGRPHEAIPLIERAIRLNPFYPGYYLSTLSQSYFLLQQYDNGLQIAEQLLARGQKENDKWMTRTGYLWIAINFVGLGQKEQAQAHMKEYLKINPGAIVDWLEAAWKDEFQNPADLERILDAAHKTGMRRFNIATP